MAIYAIGDIQGCYTAFIRLLDLIQFDDHQDRLWFTGDLVNRSPQSLEVLRFIKSLGSTHQVVLGNHDLHLLAIAYGIKLLRPLDTFQDVLNAPDRDELIEWLRTCPLLHYDASLNMVMVHAGFSPVWTLKKAQQLAREVEEVLQSESANLFLQNMYGNEPDSWDDALQGKERWRCITNYLTRVRLCDISGCIDLSYKGKLKDKPAHLIPWFDIKNRSSCDVKIIFGHWAALGGQADVPNVYPLDTGCVWGNCLTAMRLSDEKRFSVPC